jgi:S-adenosylmethionine uptake transporter
LSDANAISYAAVLYVALLSPPLLHEPVPRRLWLTTALGFVGALLTIRPTFAGVSWPHFAALLGTSLTAFAIVLTRRRNATVPR